MTFNAATGFKIKVKLPSKEDIGTRSDQKHLKPADLFNPGMPSTISELILSLVNKVISRIKNFHELVEYVGNDELPFLESLSELKRFLLSQKL